MAVAELAGGEENRMDSPRCQMTQQAAGTRLQSFLHSQISSCLFCLASVFLPSQSERTCFWSPYVTWLPWQLAGKPKTSPATHMGTRHPCHLEERKEKKKKKTAPVLCNSLQFWETRAREAIDSTALGCSSGTFPFIDTNMVVKSLDSNPRQT